MTVIFADPPRMGNALEVRHRLAAPVILLGQSSSGTSICSALLRNHLRIAFGTESQFFVRYIKLAPRYGDLHNDANLRALVDDLCRERWFERLRKFDYQVDPQRILSRVKNRTLRGVIDAAYADYAAHQGMVRWGDKTPEYMHHLDEIRGLLPDAQYIHLVRDGRDVTLSHFGRHWGPKNIVSGALEWREQVGWVRDLARRLPPEQFHEIRYEDLLSRPVDALAGLVKFLQVEDPDGTLVEQLSQRVEKDVRSDNFDKWRKKMTPAQVRRFDAIAGATLAKYGYDTTNSQDGAVRLPTRCAAATHSWLNKWRHGKQWSETWYKAGVRGRDILRRFRRP